MALTQILAKFARQHLRLTVEVRTGQTSVDIIAQTASFGDLTYVAGDENAIGTGPPRGPLVPISLAADRPTAHAVRSRERPLFRHPPDRPPGTENAPNAL